MNIQVVKQADSNLPYLIYKTATSIRFVTRRREDEKYFDEESFALPVFLVPLLDVKTIDVENLPVIDSTFYSNLQIDNFEDEEVLESTRELFFQHDCRDVPLTENQMGTYSMIWDLEDAWGTPSTKPWRTPRRSGERTNLEKYAVHNTLAQTTVSSTQLIARDIYSSFQMSGTQQTETRESL